MIQYFEGNYDHFELPNIRRKKKKKELPTDISKKHYLARSARNNNSRQCTLSRLD